MRTLTAPLVAAWLGFAGLALSSVAAVAPAEAQQAGGWRKEVAEKAKAAQESLLLYSGFYRHLFFLL